VTATSEILSPAVFSVNAPNVPSALWATVVVQPFSWMASQITSRLDAILVPLQLASPDQLSRRMCSVYRLIARRATGVARRKTPTFCSFGAGIGQQLDHRPTRRPNAG
jgi:hypothetical protein